MTFKEIIDKFEELNITKEEFGHGDFDFDENIFGKTDWIHECKRSSDGDHDSCETVVHFKDHGVYIAVYGYYSSNDGCDFSYADKFYHVEPREVTRIEYCGIE